jgi:membrane associated rhomboid family serine protease
MLSDRDYYRSNPQGGGRPNFWRSHSITINLVVINVICFLLQKLTGERFTGFFALDPVAELPLRLLQCFTYQFLHSSFSHIFWNMYSLWLFGSILEQRIGRRRFLALYLSSGVLGGIFFLLANLNGVAYCVGASGAVCGVLAATAMVYPNLRLFFFAIVPLKLWWYAVGYFLLEFYYATHGSLSGIAHCAHLGGALAGFLYMLFRSNSAVAPSWLRNLFRPRPAGRKDEEPGWHVPPPPPPRDIDRQELDRILDKMARQGFDQLTPAEKETMRAAAAELRRRRGEQ